MRQKACPTTPVMGHAQGSLGRYRALVGSDEMSALRCSTPPIDIMELAMFVRETGAVIALGLDLIRADAEQKVERDHG